MRCSFAPNFLKLHRRDADNEFAAVPGFAVHGYGTVMESGNFFHHRKSETRSAVAVRRVGLIKSVENLFKIIIFYSDSVVPYAQYRKIAVRKITGVVTPLCLISRITAKPSFFGIIISRIIASYTAKSIYDSASSPSKQESTLYPDFASFL